MISSSLPKRVLPLRRLLRLSVAFSVLAALSNTARPAEAGSGTIEGRVLNIRSGSFVEGAQITIPGTSLATFTDADGYYRLGNVPAGEQSVRVAFTGAAAQVGRVAVPSGAAVRHDVSLSAAGVTDENLVKLNQFVVEAERSIDGAALAINEQRIAPNVKNVVSTDEFGIVAEGNVAEFLKFMPGVTIAYNGGTARGISIDGVPANNVPVTLDGFSVASAPLSGNTDRAAQMDIMSLNNLSRVEVSYSPTPESPGSALAGSVNMIPRSAFERPRPVARGSVYVVMRDTAREWGPTPGPRQMPTRKIIPGGDFSYVVPVNKQFGFTVSGSETTQYSEQLLAQNTWRGSGSGSSGTTFAATTPDKPYLSGYTTADQPKMTRRASLAGTVDYRLGAYDRFSFSLQYATYKSLLMNRSLAFNLGSVPAGNFSLTGVTGGNGAGSLTMSTGGIERANRTTMPSMVWRHNGPVWQAEGGLGASRAVNRNRDIDKGYFGSTSATRTGVTIAFNEISDLRPGTMTVLDAARAPVDPFNLATYSVTSANSTQNITDDRRDTLFLNARRTFAFTVPLAVKAGIDVRRSARDIEGQGTLPLTFVGPNRNAAPFLDASFSQRDGPNGLPKIQWLNPSQFWEFYQANPGQFTEDANSKYRSVISNSKYAQELITAGFVRGDLQLLDQRLKLVGGLRAEQTNIDAEGPLTDPSRNIQRDASGRPILGANGRPLAITSDALATSKLTFISRGARAEKEYLRLFPSINASFHARESLVLRAAYYYSVGRPNYGQYNGGMTLPNTENPPAANNRITLTNVGIKAWTAKSTKLRAEYYFEGVGQVSVGVFRRDFRDFFGTAVAPVSPAMLDYYGLDPAIYGDYEVSTQYNIASPVRMEGVDFSYKQALTFLPHWARGLQVFFNGAATHSKGDGLDSFTDRLAIPLTGSWGFSLSRERYNLNVNWNSRSRQRGDIVTGASIGPDTYNWTPRRRTMDVSGEYYFQKNTAVFFSLRNLTGVTDDTEIYGPQTPAIAKLRARTEYGSLWQFGVKSSF